jgi:hypothetical protein
MPSRKSSAVRKGLRIAGAASSMVAKNISMELGAEGFNLSVDSGCVRRLKLDFT